MPSLTLALGLLGLALGLAASWLTLPCPHFWAARELRVLRMGANASSAATERVQPTLGSLLGARSLGSLLGGAGGIWGAPAADAYTSNGSRLQCASEAAPNSTVYLADAGRPWQWAAEPRWRRGAPFGRHGCPEAHGACATQPWKPGALRRYAPEAREAPMAAWPADGRFVQRGSRPPA